MKRYLLAIILGTLLIPCSIHAQIKKNNIKVLAFDAFPVFDPRPIASLTDSLFPNNGKELLKIWRAKQFEYQWLHDLSETYVDFTSATTAALVYAAKATNQELTEEKKQILLQAYLKLKPWPDVVTTLSQLKAKGIKLVIVSNMTTAMLQSNLQANRLDTLFDEVYSTDEHKCYKPSPKAYNIPIKALKMKKSEIGFVAFAGWDAAGAKAFGYPTFWINRSNQTEEELGFKPDWQGNNLEILLSVLNQ